MYQGNLLYNHCGDDSVEDPPVLIPNTEVKLNCAESTWPGTAWEDKESPHSIFKAFLVIRKVFYFRVTLSEIFQNLKFSMTFIMENFLQLLLRYLTAIISLW